MSNTYFQIKKEVHHTEFDGTEEVTKYDLTLTAFVGGKSGNHTQLTISHNINRSIPLFNNNYGLGYIVLNDKDVDDLIAGLLERKNGEISATGNEKSKYCPSED
jgi:hypothetical protein